MKIKKVFAREILDSRGNPTVECAIYLDKGLVVKASVASGASTGIHEALELRDGDTHRFGGKGVLKAVMNINKKIAPKLIGFDATKQKAIDELMLAMDGTKNKSKLGANAILAVSMAVARAGALSKNLPLYQYLRDLSGSKQKKWKFPYATMNVLNGGKHADNNVVVQEFMIVPAKGKMSERIRVGAEIFQSLKQILKSASLATLVGDEGGFAPNLKSNEQAFDLLMEATKKAGYVPGKDVFYAVDLALSEYHDDKSGSYSLNDKTGKKRVSAQVVIETMKVWLKKYPLVSIEDPLAEDDWNNWTKLTQKIGGRVALVGDDLFVTNEDRLNKGIECGAGNAILIKLNQIGTVSETLGTIAKAQLVGYRVSVSHRSGETADTFISDLAVAVSADFIKTGSLSRSERVEKYNRLMEIENELQ